MLLKIRGAYVDKNLIGFLALAISLCAPHFCGLAQTSPQRGATVQPGPLPAEVIFRRSEYSSPSLSPNGGVLAVIVPVNERRNLALVDIEKRTAQALTSFKDVDVSSYRWHTDDLLEIRLADMTEASGNLFLNGTVLIRPSGEIVRRYRGIGTGIVRAIDPEGRKFLVYKRERASNSLDAYAYDPVSGQSDLLTFDRPREVYDFIADNAGNVRFALSDHEDGKRKALYYRSNQQAAWKLLQQTDTAARNLIEPVGFMPDNKTAIVRARRDDKADTESLYYFDPEANTLGEALYAARRVDAGQLLFDHKAGTPVGVRYTTSTKWLDPQWEALQKGIDAELKGQINELTWARSANNRVLIESHSDINPGRYFLLDRNTNRMEEIVQAAAWLKQDTLSERKFVSYKARDGLEIPAYLTLPKGTEPKGLPLVVEIHGGPFVYGYRAGFNNMAQFLASRGIAVLQPNFRGTLGYGDKFAKSGWKQYGLAMQDDITDGVRWLIERGTVDPKRVCLIGASYGGYATLMGLVKEPGMFRCGVAWVALADLELKFSVTWSDYMRSEGYRSAVNGMLDTVGDPVKDQAVLRANSPIHQAAKISAPVLLAYGGLDQRVPLVHGQKLRDAMDAAGKPYEWVVYKDEAHGFNKDANRFDFYRKMDAFLSTHLDLKPK